MVAELTQQGHPGAQLLEAARASLVGAIHLGIAIGALVAVIAVWQSRRVPPIAPAQQDRARRGRRMSGAAGPQAGLQPGFRPGVSLSSSF